MTSTPERNVSLFNPKRIPLKLIYDYKNRKQLQIKYYFYTRNLYK